MTEKVFSFIICLYVIVSLDLLLTTVAVIGQLLLGLELEAPFNQPYLSNSLKEFWGWRWNRVSTTILRATVFDPIVHHAPPAFGLPLILGLLSTFLISGAMHEILHYFLSRGKTNGGGMATFFILHGFLLMIESVLKKRLNNKWRLPLIIIGPIIYGFVIYTFMIFASPDLMQCDVYDRAIQEWEAFGAVFRDMV
ncbi:hypothetical protein Leryth_019660 [Lithospermum erythrorhizon]|nr:hypothetical protein Leryth_019660 [Lithospermum erythrorhizon]